MVAKSVWYFPSPKGQANTEKTLNMSKERALEMGIKHVIVASTTGTTGLRAVEFFAGSGIKVIVVSHQAGLNVQGHPMSQEVRKKIESQNTPLLIATNVLSSPGRFSRNAAGWKRSDYTLYNTIFPIDMIADTLRMFCQGMKVCVEIVLMAADAGLIPMDQEIISISGTARGADTAIVAKPAYMTNIFDFKIREIIAMPKP